MSDMNPFSPRDDTKFGNAMQELEPSPVEETPSQDLEKSYFPPPSRSTTSSLGLSSTRHRLPQILLAIQKYSVIPPSIYLLMHYTNTALIPLTTQSLSTSDNLLLLTRPYYQSFPLEPLLIFAPIVSHILSGITLRIYRRRQSAIRHGAENHADRRRIPWPKLSLTSALGYALYPMLAAHVYINRILPLKVEGGSSSVGLRYFAHGISKHQNILSVAYSVMIGIASFHFVGGAAKYLGLTSEYVSDGGEDGRMEKSRRKWAVNGISAVVAAIWINGGLGVVGRGGRGSGWEARGWDDMLLQVPLIGKWL